jgi:membrane fusion protein, multidrug efflux system
VRRKWIIAASAVIVIAIAATLIVIHKPKRVQAPPPPPAPVATDITLTGRIEPRTLVTVAAPVEGIIDAYYLDVGQPVYKDQLLGRIRNSDLESSASNAQLALDKAQSRVTELNGRQLESKLEASRAEADQSRAQSDLARLKKEYERQKGLWEVGATPRLTFEKAEKDYKTAQNDAENLEKALTSEKEQNAKLTADLDAANAAVVEATKALESAKANINRGEIHSPEDGLIVARKGAPGESVDANSKDLFTIGTDLTQLQIIATGDTSRIHQGQSATILMPDEIPGTVREVQGNQVIVDFTSPVPITKLDLTAQVKIKF